MSGLIRMEVDCTRSGHGTEKKFKSDSDERQACKSKYTFVETNMWAE